MEEVEQQQEQELPEGNEPQESQDEVVVANEAPEQGERIVFRGKEFNSQQEAIAYFEQLDDQNRDLERKAIEAEAYNMGIRDSLSQYAQPQTTQPAEEENFEEKFYSDPKSVIEEVRSSAKQDALTEMRKELAEERAWQEFSGKFPDLADSRDEVERILQSNPYLLQIRDKGKAQEELATKVRSYFRTIAEKFTPTRELQQKKGQGVSAGTASQGSVTPKAQPQKSLTFAEQLQTMRRRG